ncbi:xanthine dehydrogenase family protein molybdopterin-binding subunit [Algoriphagus formosus]|uniref:Xanthine dehydrogenase family protein molybdopterin-binding subunit n=1 Tax=Algoriphagus formosus TaxID=2007308 RepID=A0A4R5VGK4_9BACT|nr:xanthine dehydrogenase family protein molybdopterin-binding subunit [Algoriphagus aquimaris]TDK50933.1 xanthine dehydrogenase family protein molybdopterin-binding subunit [Algoriphagus aquimaris]
MKKWTRRAFIGTGILASGALVIGVAIRPGNRSSKVAGLIAEEGETVMNIWLKISPDNTVTAIIPHAEMGQGVHTTLAMMLADEMDADWSKVKFMEAPADKEYANYVVAKGFIAGNKTFPKFLEGTIDGVFLTAVKTMNFQITGGSASVRFTGQQGMRIAGAAAKAMLLQAAADTWKVPVEELKAEKSTISHPGSNRTATFAELAQAAAKVKAPKHPRLKTPEEFTLMGTSQPRLDIPAKVTGEAKFGMDVIVPNMKYATIKAAPVFGSKVKTVDTSVPTESAGLLKVLNLGNAVAVIADGYWQAKSALDRLDIEFESTENDGKNQDDIFNGYQIALEKALEEKKIEEHFRSGDALTALSGAETIVEAEYQLPFLAHATMEPMNCTAWVHDGKCEIWCGSQNPLGAKAAVAEFLDISPEQVTVHNQLLGGGFGRRSETDVIKQAVAIAKEVDYPVKLIWSREEDTQHDVYREATISRMKAGLDQSGNPVAYSHQFLFKHHPPEAADIPYTVPNQLIQFTSPSSFVPWGNWRSVDHSVHGFLTESFIDELAFAAKKDPLAFRKRLTQDKPRFQKVLDLIQEKSNWNSPLPANWGRGIAIAQSFGSIVAEVAEVEVNVDGKVKVHRVVCVADAGFAIHPDGFKAQMESGIIYGLAAAMSGEITIENGAVAQSNFHDYQVTRMSEAPKIETHIINSGNPPGGAGEPSTPIIAPAVTNAIFNATGVRIRQLPISKTDLRVSIQQTT